MGPYSTDLRQRIIAAVNHDKKPPAEVATQFRVGVASVYRYLQLDRDLHDLTPLKGTGRPRKITAELEARLLEQVRANNDLTLAEHCQRFEQTTGVRLSITCLHQSLERANITRKKNDSRPRARPG